MDKRQNIMDSLKDSPFKLPSNYVSDMEERVRARIHSEDNRERAGGFNLSVLRTNFALLLSFLFIFAIGYGVIKIVTPKDYLNNTPDNNIISSVDSSLLKDYNLYVYDDSTSTKDEEAIEEYLIDSGVTTTMLASTE